MKNFILSITLLVISGLSFAQDLESIIFNPAELKDSQLKLSKNWQLEIEKQIVSIKNGRISNQSSKNSERMTLELYFCPTIPDLYSGEIQGYPISSFSFKGINANSSIAGVSIQFADQNLPPDGRYFPVLILTQSGIIKDIHQLRYQISTQNDKVLILQGESNEKDEIEEQTATVTTSNISPDIKSENIKDSTEENTDNATNMSGVTNPNEDVKMILENDNSIVLDGEWKIEMDFKNFMVSLIGGSISNNSFRDINHLKIDVFLTKEKQSVLSENFDGLLIASVPFDSPIKAGSTFVDTTIRTNLKAIPFKGPQYILMMVSEIGNDGKTHLKSYRAFDNPITPY